MLTMTVTKLRGCGEPSVEVKQEDYSGNPTQYWEQKRKTESKLSARNTGSSFADGDVGIC